MRVNTYKRVECNGFVIVYIILCTRSDLKAKRDVLLNTISETVNISLKIPMQGNNNLRLPRGLPTLQWHAVRIADCKKSAWRLYGGRSRETFAQLDALRMCTRPRGITARAAVIDKKIKIKKT